MKRVWSGVRVMLILMATGLAAATGFLLFMLIGGFWGLLLGVFAFPFWMLGAMLGAAPVWRFMHVRGMRSRQDFILSGGLVSGIAAPLAAHLPLAIASGRAINLSDVWTPTTFVIAAGPGLLAGYILWKLAYGNRARGGVDVAHA
ncbi:hypothetical protein GCM10009422_05900 [Brevundimonas kwangchunensis]|uniref:Major facilitator superfamily (MFS) profile domain-containing protein n=1 Tax=Brevundimonas kwangchunensis TaxID=322163 RepID=A0ABN1GL21_9CAUL